MPDELAALLTASDQATLAWTLVALALATLVSEDLACIAGGLLVAQGTLSFAPATAACFAGIFAGDLLLVLLGRTVGRYSLAAPPLRWCVSAGAVERASHWLARRGPGLVFASRFVPGTRLPTYVAVGVLRAPLGPFIGWFALACALWTPLLVGLAMLAGHAAETIFARWSSLAPVLVGAGLAAWITTRLMIQLSTWRGRRLLLSRWRRLTRWEFWPLWAVYPPVVVYILWLSLRHRSFAILSIVNPGMGGGSGFCGESKSEILAGLAGAGDRIARWRLIEPGPREQRRAALDGFMRDADLSFPLVLKPDVGERGSGVVIARDAAQAHDALDAAPAALIAQAYVPGVEFGVFYHRAPSAAHGEILAITDKRMISVTGDGARTLEELILADDRAVCMAAYFLRKHLARLDTVPAAGEVVPLTELGTHCRGALFLDGTHLVTPALRSRVEQVSRAYAGFHFGRYDVRAPSVELFQQGEFSVIELNGLASEATSIYDPRHSVWHGWRMLCRQWRIAFAIAAENRSRGAQPLTLAQIWRLIAAHQPSSP